jgi:hypothetical protein
LKIEKSVPITIMPDSRPTAITWAKIENLSKLAHPVSARLFNFQFSIRVHHQ